MDYTGKKLYFTSSTHWDREWYQNFQGFRYRLVQVVDRAIEYLENAPEFEVFTFDGQTIVLEDYLEIRPENRERLEKLISAGRIKIGPWLCMPDEFIPSGESLITNLQIGDRLSRKYGGEQWKYGYICDIFGHTAQMAQIFNGFGIRYALLGRGTRKEELKSHFLWKAPDGSECITYRLEGRGAYGVVASQILPKWHAASEEEKDKMIKDEVDYQFSCTNLPIALITDGIDHADLHPELLDMAAERLPDKIINTADELGRPTRPAALQLQGHGGLRDEFGLSGHDSAPCRRLRQLVPGTLPGSGRAGHGGQHQLLHEPLDKGRFAAAHWAHHTDVDIPAGACADLATDAVLFLFFQSNSPLPVALRTAPVGVGVLVVSYEKGRLIMPDDFECPPLCSGHL